MSPNLPLKSYCGLYTELIFIGIYKNFSFDLSLKSRVRIIHGNGLYVGGYGMHYVAYNAQVYGGKLGHYFCIFILIDIFCLLIVIQICFPH